MKTIFHPILLMCALLLGTVEAPGADFRNPIQGIRSRVKKEVGVLSRIFGRKAERVEDQDDDDDEPRSRPHLSPSQFPPLPPVPGTTVTTTTNQAPLPSPYLENRSSGVQKETTIVATPGSGLASGSREVQPAPPAERYWTEPNGTRTVVVPAPRPAPPDLNRYQRPPPRLTTQAPPDERDDPRSFRPPSQEAPSPSLPTPPPEAPATLPAFAASPGSAAPSTSTSPSSSSSSVAKQSSVAVPPSQAPPSDPPFVAGADANVGEQGNAAGVAGSPGAPSAPPPGTEHPVSASKPLFGTPVPGRPGFVYPPGKEATMENLIDVTGYAPGTKVRDPVSKVVFRVP